MQIKCLGDTQRLGSFQRGSLIRHFLSPGHTCNIKRMLLFMSAIQQPDHQFIPRIRFQYRCWGRCFFALCLSPMVHGTKKGMLPQPHGCLTAFPFLIFNYYCTTFSKSEAGCLHQGQVKSAGSSSPS